MITVACVLRSGGVYTPEWVQRLAAGVDRHLPLPYRFVGLSDVLVSNVECVKLSPSAGPGWWSKLSLFEPGVLRGRVLFLDLDSVIVGDLSDLASYASAFGMLSDYYRPQLAQSGIMAWDADGPIPGEIWARWITDPGVNMSRCWGDGVLIAEVLAGREDRLERLYPGQLPSWKVDCRGVVPPGARVVVFHGSPKPDHLCPSHPVAVAWRRA